ncbi:MAG: bifunctional 5,10-methylenetetrahydrofolate dehydrogenase/5,10-methenyltetrahydrofolate cyclohydrolase [Pseudomonadales bacterium]|nr:bifunctional 5,10-methylenetetrahydrofolate dehydrogenase/5,10-methenyltetrahydrofolate cyclohydrolase [Pseudomonadales bacterium]
MNVFDGMKLAHEREQLLRIKVDRDFSDYSLKIAAILFSQDAGSRIYTKLKREAAFRVGIDYEVFEYSLLEDFNKIIEKITQLNLDLSITGIIIQKPWRKTWAKFHEQTYINNQVDLANLVDEVVVKSNYSQKKLYDQWWGRLTSVIAEKKDVDGLHPNTISQIMAGIWQENHKVLPATCRAVLTILERAGEIENFSKDKIVILGKSDLLGIPLYYELLRQKYTVELIASKELLERMNSGQKLLDAKVIVSATGTKGLVKGDMISDGVIIVDVGEPKADVDFESVAPKSSFITPVPGGVGPMTVISLLENCVDLASK